MRLGVHASSFRDGLADAPRVINPGRVLQPDSEHLDGSGNRGAKVIQFLVPRREPVPRQKLTRVGPPPPLQPLSWETSAVLENSVLERPLVLLGQEREGTQAPQILLHDPERRCFAAHWSRVLAPDYSSIVFDQLLKYSPWAELTNKRGQVARQTCWYVRKGCSCTYTYGTARVCADRKPSMEFKRTIEDLADHIFTKLWPWLPRECWPNAANLNLYSDIGQSVGWHADDEALFRGQEYDCPIVSVSLGAKREFWLALKRKHVAGYCANSDSLPDSQVRDPVGMEPHRTSIVEIDLCDGDIMTMEGLCQKYCIHFVPHDTRYTTPSLGEAESADLASTHLHPRESRRINVTFRWIRDHKQRCKLFNCGIGTLFCELGASTLASFASSPAESSAALDWALGRFVTWKSCHGCDHDGWKGGRNCVKYKGFFLCRRCWNRVRETGDAILSELPTDPEAAAERKRLRILRLRGGIDASSLHPMLQSADYGGNNVIGDSAIDSESYLGFDNRGGSDDSNFSAQLWNGASSGNQYGHAYQAHEYYTSSNGGQFNDMYYGNHSAYQSQYADLHSGTYNVAHEQAYCSELGTVGTNGAFTYYQ